MAKPTKKRKTATSKEAPSLEEALAAVTEPKKLPPALASLDLPALVGARGPLDRDAVLRALVSKAIAQPALRDLVRGSTTPESRDAASVALLRFWETKGFHGRFEWVMDAVVALGGDRSTIALAEYVSAWPSQSDTGRKRAIQAIPAIASARTDTAMLALLGLRQTAVVPSVLETIIDTLDQAVEERQTTLSELFDAITPTLGLDARGRRSFDYGARRFTAAFDDHFEPRLLDDAGHAHEELPPPEPGDDPERAAASRAAWTTLAAQLREAVKVQTFRLEQDMVTGRRWDAATWSRALKDHPLLVSFTRRLLWGVYDEDDRLVLAFRTAEDQSLVGRDDTEVRLPEDARIGVVHPLDLADEARSEWATHFADYEIIQPFAQLGRTTHRTTDEERTATATTRFASTRFKSGFLRDVLVRRGWERDPSYVRQFYQRTFGRYATVAIATMSPGVAAGSASYDVADQIVPTIEFRQKKGRNKSRTAMPLAEVHPVVFSEAVLDVADVAIEQDVRSGPDGR